MKILSSNEDKQSICNAIVGASFRDIEKALNALLSNKRLTREQIDLEDLEEKAPEKFGYAPETAKKKARNYTRMEYLLDVEEVNRLLRDSESSKANEPTASKPKLNYLTYSEEEALELINNFSFNE
jgi:hypothetical protein